MVDFSNIFSLPGGVLKGGPKAIVSGLIKAFIILAATIYIISPIDFMPGLPFDDILVGIAALSTLGIKLPKLN